MEIIKNLSENLKKLNSREDLLAIFREILGFRPPETKAELLNDKNNIKKSEIIAEFGSTRVFYIHLLVPFEDTFESERKIRKIERQIISNLQSPLQRQNLFVFSDLKNNYWDFIYPSKTGPRLVLKRFNIRPDNRDKLRTPSIQFSKLVVKSGEEAQIYKKIEETFSVEAVSERFFKDYEEVFNFIKKELLKQSLEYEQIHRFAHQLLNRLMFLYFVQRRGVFNGDKNFLNTFWNTYRDNFEEKNEFYDKWLKILFFEALNGKFPPPHFDYEYFRISEDLDFNQVLRLAPYLNGGLFREDPKIDYLKIKLDDKLFIKIFDFLESYNFTARENTPLDEDLEIDPEMLGNIYEAMVNVTEVPSEDERHKAGIFYTPRTEIDFMIRRSLVEFLFNKTKIDKFKLYQFVLPEAEEEKVPKFEKEDAKKIYDILDKITILDPACGSGHYLVVAVQILFDLKKELWLQMGNSEESFKPFKEKLNIIENSIFGVDIKKWAAEIAKLRLWLDLMVSAEDEQLRPGGEALLPNLAFKIRVGDSLVQEIGGIFFRAKEIQGIPRSLIFLKNQLVDYKKSYFYGEKRITEAIVKSKEVEFFKELIDEKINELKKEIKKIEKPSNEKFKEQLLLIAQRKEDVEQLKIDLSSKEKGKIDFLKEQINHLQEEKQKISMRSEFAFWPIEFAEVLSGQDGEGGFDIIIANPPYVRQELIEDPQKPNDKNAAKKYKEKLLKQIQLDWNDEKGKLIRISQRADLYVYFYLKGLQLLNPDGVMCYICSNSWLDVGFGVGLQEVLLKRVPILAIYDNQAKRSFKQADVNTIIAVFGAPKNRDWLKEIKENKIKFVMFKKPFEEVIFSEILWQIENSKEERTSNDNFRLIQKNQWELYLEGIEEDKEKQRLTKEMGVYVGNKWGGKYLRAPEIYWTILEKGKGKLVRLGDIAEVRFGIKTGANEFFYLKPVGMSVKEVVETAEKNPDALIKVKNSAGWEGEIEAEFLKPVIKSPRELKTIIVRLEDLNHLVFMCHKSENELKGKKAWEYIKWGEKQGYHKRPTCKGRPRWWDLGIQEISLCDYPMVNYDRLIVSYNSAFYNDANLVGIYPIDPNFSNIVFVIALNLSFMMIQWELYGISNLGEGGIKQNPIYFKNFYIFNPILLKKIIDTNKIDIILQRPIHSIFTELGFDLNKEIREQEPNPLPDRKALDDIVFDALGLTEKERKEVYYAVAELVQNRLKKAKSV